MTTAKDVIRLSIGATDYTLDAYLKDLSDDDLLVVAVPGTNPIAWHLGHMIHGERGFAETIQPGSSPPLPEGWETAHAKEFAAPNAFKAVATRDEYLRAWKAQRAATLTLLDALPDERLDAPTGLSFAPTVAALLNMVGIHAVGHLGQFVAVRRKLGKPVVI
jgi:uncharacterized damage-inducible protein DinB